MDKLKASDKLAFPLELDIGSALRKASQGGVGVKVQGGADPPREVVLNHEGGEPVGYYELVGILIHKGTNAHHGHYGEWRRSP